jgi:multicomponent Na+:H+ antiporter subunit G
MINLLIAVCTGIGAIAILLASIGILRMPDLYLRLSVTTKAATLGTGLILVGGAFHFQEVGVTSRVVAIVFFTTVTAPVSAQLIGRVAYLIKAKMWEHTITDELDGMYDNESHALKSNATEDENNAPEV